MSNWHVIPYIIGGINLYAAEDTQGNIDGYFDTYDDAKERCDKLISGHANFGCLGGLI